MRSGIFLADRFSYQQGSKRVRVEGEKRVKISFIADSRRGKKDKQHNKQRRSESPDIEKRGRYGNKNTEKFQRVA